MLLLLLLSFAEANKVGNLIPPHSAVDVVPEVVSLFTEGDDEREEDDNAAPRGTRLDFVTAAESPVVVVVVGREEDLTVEVMKVGFEECVVPS